MRSAASAYQRVHESIDAALSIVKAGVTYVEVYETMTPEPLLHYGSVKMMVHEENLRVGVDGYELLSHHAPTEFPVI